MGKTSSTPPGLPRGTAIDVPLPERPFTSIAATVWGGTHVTAVERVGIRCATAALAEGPDARALSPRVFEVPTGRWRLPRPVGVFTRGGRGSAKGSRVEVTALALAGDGRDGSAKVEDPKSLRGVKVGDQVEITYTQALAMSAALAGK